MVWGWQRYAGFGCRQPMGDAMGKSGHGTQQLKNVSYIGCYVGLALIRRNKLSRRTIGVNLVLTTHHEHDHHFLLPPTRSCCVSRCPSPALAGAVLFSEAHHLAGILFPPIPSGLSREGFPRRRNGFRNIRMLWRQRQKNNRSPGFRDDMFCEN